MMNKDYSIESRPSKSAVACYDKIHRRADVGSNSEDERGTSQASIASDSSIKVEVKEEDVKIQRKRDFTDVVDINVKGNDNIVVYTKAPLNDDDVKAIQRMVADAHNRHDKEKAKLMSKYYSLLIIMKGKLSASEWTMGKAKIENLSNDELKKKINKTIGQYHRTNRLSCVSIAGNLIGIVLGIVVALCSVPLWSTEINWDALKVVFVIDCVAVLVGVIWIVVVCVTRRKLSLFLNLSAINLMLIWGYLFNKSVNQGAIIAVGVIAGLAFLVAFGVFIAEMETGKTFMANKMRK